MAWDFFGVPVIRSANPRKVTADKLLAPKWYLPEGAEVIHIRRPDGAPCGGPVFPPTDFYACVHCPDCRMQWTPHQLRQTEQDAPATLREEFYIQLPDDPGVSLVWVEREGTRFVAEVPSWKASYYERIAIDIT